MRSEKPFSYIKYLRVHFPYSLFDRLNFLRLQYSPVLLYQQKRKLYITIFLTEEHKLFIPPVYSGSNTSKYVVSVKITFYTFLSYSIGKSARVVRGAGSGFMFWGKLPSFCLIKTDIGDLMVGHCALKTIEGSGPSKMR